VLEGGSIDVNGGGTLLTTEECLLSPIQARNPGVSREDLDRVIGDYLGIRKVLWLGNGIVGDDTHGHVDDLARFVDERTVVIAEETDPGDENFANLAENRMRLESMTNADGEHLRVISLPMPAPLRLDGVRLPASYANFYIGNHAVLVPTFNDPMIGARCRSWPSSFRPSRGRHPRRRPGVGPGHAPLHDAARARLGAMPFG